MPWPRTLFPASLPPSGYGLLDSITNILPDLLNAAVLPRSLSLLDAISSPPPPDCKCCLRKRQPEAVDMSQKCLPSSTGQASRADQCEIALSEHIVPTACVKAFSEWRLSQNYRRILADNGKQTGHEIQLLFLLEYALPPPTKNQSLSSNI